MVTGVKDLAATPNALLDCNRRNVLLSSGSLLALAAAGTAAAQAQETKPAATPRGESETMT